ncbi:hypothetical protein D3C87_2015270 [compost metagenome]
MSPVFNFQFEAIINFRTDVFILNSQLGKRTQTIQLRHQISIHLNRLDIGRNPTNQLLKQILFYFMNFLLGTKDFCLILF